jgi:hypothetical protein
MRLALSIIGSTFRLPLIAAHFPKLARPFNETPLNCAPMAGTRPFAC